MKHFAKNLLVAGALVASTLSYAAPVAVDKWEVTAIGSWNPGDINAGVSLSGNTLSWGIPYEQPKKSSLVITNPAPTDIKTLWGGGVPTAEYIADSIQLTHNNFPITGLSLTSATLDVGISLKPLSPSFDGFDLTDISYQIKFAETDNTKACASVTQAGDIPCNDIFVLLDGFLNETFEYKGYKYFVNAFPTSGGVLSTLTDAECTAVGRDAGCFGFVTAENKSTDLAFGLTISSERLEVPEPGSLALMGLALAGLGFASRRRAAPKA